MSDFLIKIHNVETGEVIEREMTSQEKAFMENERQVESLREAERNNKKIARQAILDRLGLTEEEARLLLG